MKMAVDFFAGMQSKPLLLAAKHELRAKTWIELSEKFGTCRSQIYDWRCTDRVTPGLAIHVLRATGWTWAQMEEKAK
ncbi:hypothetical protein IP84_16950 [beta proteobacterium AAP99]|nr:hypothetical protein IP84_16950 [beta proteobacterium AAP99]